MIEYVAFWTFMWSSSLLSNKLTFFEPFMVVSGSKKYMFRCPLQGHCSPNHLAGEVFHSWDSIVSFQQAATGLQT